ncbi:uncharacterized protein LOC125235492 isoform X2 [Leguminivora glycinivorella]|uniref:uncharacterized protein LOC125235492 isoform X2 n=1 Tax=Leguminivora glycinivorella TaxID=1035111 RepID=UPI00200F1A3A|nr:uncharacterized protein LOC125235492 isoform X2 [Leguminivora glycinivorella]
MDVSSKSICIFSIFLLITLSSVNGQDKCVKRNSCSCVFSNGTGIDLSPSAKNLIYTSKTTLDEKNKGAEVVVATYYYHPCFDVLLTVNQSTSMNGTTCDKPLSLCRHTSTWNGTVKDHLTKYGDIFEYLGSSNDTSDGIEFSNDGRSIKYFNKPSFSIVNLVCSDTDDEFYVKDSTEPDQIELAFFSRNACLRQIESSRSTGSTLLIIFFSFVIFYLVLGVCTKKFLMGATGIEVIPNLMFWTELPNLVKDGWAFALNGFKLPARGAGPATSPDPNSYDSI